MLNPWRINRSLRSLRRSRTVVGVLIKYGFGHIVDQLNLADYLERGLRLIPGRQPLREIERLSPQVRLRMAMEELGPSFIKLGQLLSTRADLIPKAYADEFSKLQDQATQVPYEEIVHQIESALHRPLTELFTSISPLPLAAASIAQVHRAQLHEGAEVVVKVRRPGIEAVLETDIDILMGIAGLVERHLPSLALYEPTAIVREFRRSLRNEMNFSREGHVIDRFIANFAGDPTVRFPKVHWGYTAEAVLTMEYVSGIKISERELLVAAGYDPRLVAAHGAETFLKQVLVHGLFHGDPHPGNIFVVEGGTICILDFGMVGRLSEDLRRQIADLLLALLLRDPERIVNLLVYSGDISDDVSLRRLRHDLSIFIDNYYDVPLHEINVGRLLGEFIEILTLYRIKFSPDLMLLAKALVTMEGVGRQLDPDFNMIGHLKPFMERMAQEKLGPKYVGREASRIFLSYAALLKNLPRDIQEFINRVNRNKFKIELEHRGLDRLISDIDKASNRISFSLLIAALIIGSSLIMQTDKGPLLFGFPMLGFIGYSVAGMLGLWLALGIMRSGRL